MTEDWAAAHTDALEAEGRVRLTRARSFHQDRRATAKGATPPRIMDAHVTGNVTLTQSTQLQVRVDLAA